MITEVKQFMVFNAFGDLVAKGSAAECAKRCGLTESSFRQAANNKNYTRWKILETTEPMEKKLDTNELSAAKSWDDFCEPIRKKYGIPVYRGK